MDFGVIDKIYHDEYLANYTCPDCGKAHDTKLVIYCKAFVTGPVTWWAWRKRGYVECINCGAVSNIHPSSKEFKEARYIYARRSIPFYCYIPTIVLGGLSALTIIIFSIGFMIGTFAKPDRNIVGLWVSSNELSRIYFFKDNQYTLIDNDTILFGNYGMDTYSGKIRIEIAGKENTIDKVDPSNLSLDYDYYQDVVFHKAFAAEKGNNPYEKRFNRWRMKATHDESNEELRDRAMGYLYYLQLRYKWALENHINYLPNEIYSPVLQGQNGIGIYEKSVPLWRRVFYSENNWITASKFLYQSFPVGHPLNKQENNIFKRNLDAINAYIETAKRTPIE